PDGILSNGDASSSLAVQWYENNVQIVTNSNYILNDNGSLTVKNNVTPDEAFTISCRATFTDSRSGAQTIFEDSVILKAYAKSDENQSVIIDKDVICLYNPLKDSKTITVNATLRLGSTPVPSSNAAYWWYIVSGESERLISQNDAEYISGQGTYSLSLNAEMIDKIQIRVRAQYYESSKPQSPSDNKVYTDTTVKWMLPSSIIAKIESPQGDNIREGMGSMTFKCRIFDNVSEILKPETFFSIRWYCKKTSSGSVPIEVGSGQTVTVPSTILKSKNGVYTEVYPEISDLGNYFVALDKDNSIFVDESNNVLIIR
ncbi:MAG: hypothetical protein ACRCX5_02150, partial [Bacteroidales bacterium]